MTETAEAPAPQPLVAPPVTCGTPDCPAALLDGVGYATTWLAAVNSRWGSDATGQRRCPACMAARVPSAGLYIPDAEVAAWIASLDPDPLAPLEAGGERMAEPEPAPVVAAALAPLPLPAPAVPPTAASNQAADKAQQREAGGIGELNPAAEQALANFNKATDAQDAAERGPDGTGVMDAITALVPVITDEEQA